jgi:phosphoadenosine phosphosulfate reductase
MSTPQASAAYDLTTEEHLAATAAAAGAYFEGASPQEILGWAIEAFGEHFAITSSMGETVLMHMAAQIRPGVAVLFLDTGYHFAETVGTRDAVAATYDIKVHTLLPLMTVEEQDAAFGAKLHDRDPDLCCAMRKVEPLDRGLSPYLAWASGLRRDQSPTRRHTKVVDWDGQRGKVKVNPLATWSQEQVEEYANEHSLLTNPLMYDGYPSIGCAPCTRRVDPGEELRAGRWSGTGKLECGIHG